MAAKCSSCEAEILFVRMPSGKMMPVNPKPMQMVQVTAENDVTGLEGRVISVRQSHFATCPKAGEHRRGS